MLDPKGKVAACSLHVPMGIKSMPSATPNLQESLVWQNIFSGQVTL